MEIAYPGGIIISTTGAHSTDPLIAALAGAIVGALIGGCVAYFVTDRTQKSRRLFDLRTEAYAKYLGLLSPLNRMEADEWWNEYGNVRFMIRLYGSKEINDFMDEIHKKYNFTQYIGPSMYGRHGTEMKRTVDEFLEKMKGELGITEGESDINTATKDRTTQES